MPCLANYQDNFVVLIGGYRKASVVCFSFEREDWTKLPSLNKNRDGASACSVGNSVYVILGLSANSNISRKYTERLSNIGRPDQDTRWTLLELPEVPQHNFFRLKTFFVPVSDHEFLVLGGEHLSLKGNLDVHLYDTQDVKVTLLLKE